MRSRGDESWRLEDNTERKHAPLEVPEEAMRSPLLNKCSRLLKLTAQKFTHEAAVFQNSPTGYILNHRFWTRVSEHALFLVVQNL